MKNKGLTWDELWDFEDRETMASHNDLMRWRFFRDKMTNADRRRLLLAGPKKFDKMIDKLRQ